MPFFLNLIQAPLSIVSFCVREEFTFHLTNGEELLAIWNSCFFILCFDMYCFFKEFWLLISFLFFWNHGMGSFIYDILFTLLLSRGSFAVTPLDILDVKWMEPRNSIPDFLTLSYLQGLSRTTMNTWPIRKTATRRHSTF